VVEDVARMAGVFDRLGYTVVDRTPNPRAAQLRDELGAWLEGAALGPSDAVVLYFSGHGLVAAGDHYLCPRGFDRDDLATTGLKTRDMIDLVMRRKARPGRFWLILDCCQAGGVLHDGLLGALAVGPANAFVLAASGGWDQALDGCFSRAFCAAVHETSRARTRRTASLDQLTQSINHRAGDQRAVQLSISSERFDLLDPASGRRLP
jgi:hypothetical protein